MFNEESMSHWRLTLSLCRFEPYEYRSCQSSRSTFILKAFTSDKLNYIWYTKFDFYGAKETRKWHLWQSKQCLQKMTPFRHKISIVKWLRVWLNSDTTNQRELHWSGSDYVNDRTNQWTLNNVFVTWKSFEARLKKMM